MTDEAKALVEWFDKTEWVQDSVQPHELGLHRADVLRNRIETQAREIERLREMLKPQWFYHGEDQKDRTLSTSAQQCPVLIFGQSFVF